MKVTSVTVSVPVRDLAVAAGWYRRLWPDRDPIEPVSDIVEFEVIPGSWLQLIEGEPCESLHTFRLGVPDIDAERRRIEGLGVAIEPVERVEGAVAHCEFLDPDGNRLSLYEVLDE